MKQSLTILLILVSVFANAQNVGIGTNVPATSALLELNSTTKGLLLPRINNTAMSTLGAAGPDGLVVFNTDQNGLFVRRNGQFVRVSDTSRPFVLPYSGNATNSSVLFQIQNFGTGGAFYGLSSSNTNPVIKGEAFGSGDGVQGFAVGGTGVIGLANDGTGIQGLSTSGYGGFFTSTSGHALITNNGNVGFGTFSPTYKLDVNGRMRIRHNGLTSGLWLNKSDNTEGSFIGMINDTTAGFWGNATSGSWKVAVDVKNGLMGIGTTDPSAPLSFSNGLGNKISLWGNASGGHYGLGIQGSLMQIYSEGTTSDIALGYGSSAAFTENFKFKGNGNMHIGKYNTWATTADTRKLNWGDGDYVYITEQDADDRLSLRAGSFDFRNGDVFIGATDFTKGAGYKLRVNGKIISEEVLVQNVVSWPDYVFGDHHTLMPLQNLQQYINEHKHLPNIPAAVEIEKNGLPLGDMQKKMMEKIEELTLYILQQQKKIETLETKVNSQK